MITFIFKNFGVKHCLHCWYVVFCNDVIILRQRQTLTVQQSFEKLNSKFIQ